MTSQQFPIVRLKLGDDFQTIQQQSTYQFSRRPSGKIDALPIGEPVTVEYSRPGCSFTLPPSRSFGASMNNGRAVSLTISPQLHYNPLSEATNLIHSINSMLERSNWKRLNKLETVEQVQARFRDSKEDSDLVVGIEDWHCGDDESYFELARDWRRGDSLPLAARKDYDFCVFRSKSKMTVSGRSIPEGNSSKACAGKRAGI